jgi:hypothetical protein
MGNRERKVIEQGKSLKSPVLDAEYQQKPIASR